MPMNRDAQGGGTEADGSRSGKYCSHCYAEGKFILPYLTAQDMQERVRDKMIDLGFPRLFTGFFTRKIPQLERWNSSS